MYLEEEKGRILKNFASIRMNIINILEKLEKNLKRDIAKFTTRKQSDCKLKWMLEKE